MHRIRTYLLPLVLLAGSVAPLIGQVGETGALHALQNRLEAVHPGLRALRARLRAARADLRQEGRKPNPSLALGVEELGGGAGGTPAEAEWNLSFSQPLEGRSLRRARRQVTRHEIEGMEHRLQALRRKLRGELARRWFTLLADRARWSQRQAALSLLQEGVAAVRGRFEAGAASQLEVHRSRNEALRIEAEAREATIRIDTDRQRLAVLLQEPVESLPGLQGTTLPSLDLPELDRALSSLEDHPAVRAARAGVRSARAGIDRVWAERRGEREVEAGLRRLGHAGTTMTLGLRVPLRVHDRKRGAMDAARARWEEARAEVDETLLGFEDRIVELHGELAARKAALDLLRSEALPAARSAFALALEGYRRGKFTFLEFLEAQKALVDLRGRLAELQGETCSFLGEWHALLGTDEAERTKP